MNAPDLLPDLDDQSFVRTWSRSRDLAEVARDLGMSRAAASTKASRLRALGLELPRFRTGRKADTLPVALQVRRWTWSRVKGGRVEHRRPAGRDRAICGADLVDAEDVARGLRPCPACWPVEAFPPRTDPIPADLVAVVVLTSSTSAELAERRDDGELVDVETGEPIPLELLTRNLGWWTP